MATINLRVEDEVRDRLQALADGRDVSLSDLVRSTLDGLFDRDIRGEAPTRNRVVPESLNAVDRKQLALLHRILARLVEDVTSDDRLAEDGDTGHQLDRAQALEEGWAREYDMEFYGFEAELSRRDCGLVMDLLDMFRVLKSSLTAVSGVSRQAARTLTFRGFDMNDVFESRLLTYARWLVLSEGRWAEQAEAFSTGNDRGNSHAPLLGSYRRILDAYEPIWRDGARAGDGRGRYLLTVDELERVSAAAVHPGRRSNL